MDTVDDLTVNVGGRAKRAALKGSALAVKPTTYAFPENYGNPKNKVYQLSAGAADGVRLKALDGTIIFEGKGPEAAAKAADLVQQMGKQYGPQATWILDKQAPGGDWQQVSQDTVGKKKTTALNAFLNVAAPIAGAFIPGLGPLLGVGAAGGAAAGAALGSVANSALQNKNSAQALKDAAIAASTAYLGSKLTGALGSKLGANTSLAPDLGSVGDLSGGFGAGQAASNIIASAPASAAMQAAGASIPEIVVTASKLGLTAGQKAALGLAGGAGVTALANGIGNVPSTGSTPTANAGTTQPPIEEIVVTGSPKVVPTDYSKLAVAGGTLGSALAVAPNMSGVTKPDFNPELDTGNGPIDKITDWVKANPLQAASYGLSALGGLAGGAAGNAGTYPASANIAGAGTRSSLSPTFNTGALPPPSPNFEIRAPAQINMTTDEWLKYGLGPEKSFFQVTPQDQPVTKMAHGGFAVRGSGTGRSDDIPAVLSDGEYVIDAETVALLGDGSNKAGAEKLDQLRVNLRRHKGANLVKGRFSVNAKSPEKYLSGGRA